MLNLKKMMVAVMALAMILAAGLNREAKAFSVVANDLYLILYGNGTEKYYDLGALNTALNGPALNISAADLTLVGGANPVKWAVAGFDSTNTFIYNTISQYPLTAAQQAALSLTLGFTNFAGFFALNTDGNAATTSMSLLASNGNSYSNQLDLTGNGSFASSYPVSTSGKIGNTLQLISGNINTNALATLTNTAAQAVFATLANATGGGLTFSIGPKVAATPLPTSVVMFVTGIIALFVIARRKEASI